MKISRSKKNKKQLVMILALTCGILAIVSVTWYIHTQNNSTPTAGLKTNVGQINYSPPTEEEETANETQKGEIIKEQTASPPTDTSLSVSLSRTFQDANGFNLRTVVDGTSTGDCVATFTKNGQLSITKTFPVIFEATSASCQNALVPISEFPASGTWSLSLIVIKDNKQSEPAIAMIEIAK